MPESPEIDEAISLIAAGRYDDAAALCSRVLTARPLDVGALHAHGVAELKRGRYAQAVESLERALEQAPENPALLNNCGEACRLNGETERAFEYFKRAIQIEFAIPMAHVNIGLAMRSLGKAREAEHFFKNAILLDPEMERAHFELAELYREEGHTPEAIERYREALAISPGSSRSHRQLASLLLREGRTRDALEAVSEAVRIDPRDGQAHFILARALLELCSDREAEASYLRAVELLPALSPHAERRVVTVRRTEARDWAARENGQYWQLARSHSLQVPRVNTIPAEAAASWTVGQLNEPVAPEMFLCRIADAEVLPGDFTVLTSTGDALIGGLVNWAHHYDHRGRFVVHAADDGRLLLDLPGRCETLDEPCAVMGGAGDYFDWLFGGVARLWALEQQPRATGLPLIVAGGLDPGRQRLLESLGVETARLRPLPEDRTFRCAELYVPSLPVAGDWVSPLAVQFLRRRLLAAASPAGNAGRRIYLSRGAMSSRRVVNEHELLPLLARHGFESVNAEALDTIELIDLFRTAQALVAVDDEVLANLVVSPQGAKIGAIVAYGIHRPRAYFVSAQIGQDFTYLQAEPRFESNPVHAECDVALPPDSLEQWLARLQ